MNEIVVDPPPHVPKQVFVNPLARLLPVAMLVAMLGMMAFYFTSGASVARSPMFMFFPVMMLGSVLGTLFYGARGTNQTAEVNQNRRNYLRYLDTLDFAVSDAANDQRRSSLHDHPEPGSLWTLAGGPRMWERGPEHPEFGRVRIGCGDGVPSMLLKAPELGPAEDLDPVTADAMRRLVDTRSVVADMPHIVPLRDYSVVAVEGEPTAARAVVRSLVCQLAVLHSPDDVAIAAVTESAARDEWDWLKWLPHHRSSAAYAVLIVDGATHTDSQCNGTIIDVGGGLDDGPESRRLRIPTDVADALTRLQALVCARRLAPYRNASKGSAHGWPALMEIDDVEQFAPNDRWSTVTQISPVPIGVADDGTCISLDINEAARGGMGPHGLCVGATGSGKSELLRTLTLGMVATHPPELLNLILVDFKGGATFLGLERTPHVSAVITNLANESHLVNRMNDAIAGEMNRRQELLRAAGNYANVAEYERARSHGAAIPPLPALFIMVDEFSELLSQHPDFADLFVAVGRLGRSLGMHLLLASQRLDEGRLRGLETHLSYRICLKTFSAGESRAVLGIGDAHQLPSTPGAAYLKTAAGDLLRFQTAFVSGPVKRKAAVISQEAQLFTSAMRYDTEQAEAALTVMDAMLSRLAGRGTPARQVWLPPLTESPTLDMLPTVEGSLTETIGLVDNPYEQRRDPFIVELSGAAGNVAVVGAPRTGKSTTLRTLMLALAQRHDPRDVSFYCLDFGGGALSALSQLPHVGAVATRRDVDLCRRTVTVVESLIRSREASDEPYGHVFLVIDGWAPLRQEFDVLEQRITAIAAQGLSFGVHVMVTASRWAELRPGFKDQIGTRIELRLGDPAESEMDRRRARDLGDRPPGRGITATGRELVIAVPPPDMVGQLLTSWGDRRATPIEVLPTLVHRRDLMVTGRRPILGIDEWEMEPVALDFAEHQHLLILGESGCGKSATLRLLCTELTDVYSPDEAQLEIIDFRRTLLGVVDTDHLAAYTMSPVSLTSRLPKVFDMLEARMPDETVTQQQLRTRSWWTGPEIYLVVDDYDLVAGTTGNPLARLADFLPHAGDLGLHLIVARRSGGAARAMFDPVLARMRDAGCMGLMMSASPDEGVLLGSVRPSPLPPGRGTLITRGESNRLIQVAWTDPP